jgi:hypothetical protein
MSIRLFKIARRGIPLALLLSLLGCAAAPPAPSDIAAAPMPVSDAGLVIGTLSYNYVTSPRSRPWVVHFERLDTPARADYALGVSVDSDNQRGVFTGTLPAGVYAFREAALAESHYSTSGMKMPFEVQAGEVKDVGHYALSPVAAR